MKAAIDHRDMLRRYADVVFYDQRMDGTIICYRPDQYGLAWHQEVMDPGAEIPYEFKWRLPLDALESLAEEVNKITAPTGQADKAVLETLKLEQGRVDKLLDHLTKSREL